MNNVEPNPIRERFLNTMAEISDQIVENANVIDIAQVLKLIDMVLDVVSRKSMIFVYGAGRSGFIGRCFAQRLMHLGIKSCFVSDAVTHRYGKEDLLIIVSGSGSTTTPLAIAGKARDIGGKIALFTRNPLSAIGKLSDIVIQVEGKSKDQAISRETFAPYTSLFDISTFAILDSICALIMGELNVTETLIDQRHASIE